MSELFLSYTSFAHHIKEMYGYNLENFIRQGKGHITLYYPTGKTMIMELNDNAVPNICGNVYTNVQDLFIVLTKIDTLTTEMDTLTNEQKDKHNQFVNNCIKQWKLSGNPYDHCSISKDDCLRGRLEIVIMDNKKIRCYCPRNS